jgi:hypothetical protein
MQRPPALLYPSVREFAPLPEVSQSDEYAIKQTILKVAGLPIPATITVTEIGSRSFRVNLKDNASRIYKSFLVTKVSPSEFIFSPPLG